MKCNAQNCMSSASSEWKCSKCNVQFCTLLCLSKHISSTHTVMPSQTSFLKKGTLLGSNPQSDPYYQFSNFEFVLNTNKQLKCIGSGAFGDLYLSKNKIDDKQFAIKQINKAKVLETGVTFALIKREIGIHIRIIHPNIVRLYSQHEDNKNFYMIMEYIPNGTLFQEIQRTKGLSEEKAFKYFIQVSSAIHFLHQNGFSHRDIKPENVLIDNDGNVKLCDFGWCVDVSSGERRTFCGTYEYMAPEIVNDQYYDYSTDIWSLGVLLYEMIHAYSPFRAQRGNDAMSEVLKNIKERKYTIDQQISKECRDIIDKLLTSDTKMRIKIEDIFEDPWVKQKEAKLIEKSKPKEGLNSFNQSSSSFAKEQKEKKSSLRSTKKEYKFTDRSDKDDFDDLISKVSKVNEIKQLKKEQKQDKSLFNTPIPLLNKTNIISLETNDLSESMNLQLNSKSFMSSGPVKKKTKGSKQIINIDDLEISESEEFAFLKDIKNYQSSKKTYDPSKVLNMNFLPKDILYKEGGYKESANEILATIDLLDNAQKAKEEGDNGTYVTKKEKKESFWDKFFKNFQCGQCS